MSVRDNIRDGKYVNQITTGNRGEYRSESRRLNNLFATDLLAEVGMVGHPKADAFFNYCYEQGHAYGHYEVLTIADELVELVK